MLCPGLRLAAYLAVQAKHRGDPGGRGQRKQKISTEYFPTNPTDESNLLQSQPDDILVVNSSQYMNLRVKETEIYPRYCPVDGLSEKDRGIFPLVSGGQQY